LAIAIDLNCTPHQESRRAMERNMSRIVAMGIGILASASAHAFETPRLPANAKALKGPEIEALYRGAFVVGTNFEQRDLVTFVARIAPDARRFVVHVFSDNRPVGSGEFAARIEGDLWCYRPVSGGQEKCVTVHIAGEVIYELTRDGRISARNLVSC
jgi:hypothetical protein